MKEFYTKRKHFKNNVPYSRLHRTEEARLLVHLHLTEVHEDIDCDITLQQTLNCHASNESIAFCPDNGFSTTDSNSQYMTSFLTGISSVT